MAQEGDGNVILEPTRLRLTSRHQTFALGITQTATGAGNVGFQCGDLWNVDNTGFLVFGVVNRVSSVTNQIAYINFTGCKFSGGGTAGTYNIITEHSLMSGSFSLSAYDTSGSGHGTQVTLTSVTASQNYRLDLYVVNVSRTSVD